MRLPFFAVELGLLLEKNSVKFCDRYRLFDRTGKLQIIR